MTRKTPMLKCKLSKRLLSMLASKLPLKRPRKQRKAKRRRRKLLPKWKVERKALRAWPI